MTALLPSPRPRPQEQRDPIRTLDALATVIFLVLSVAVLYVARDILVPISIAVILSFVLSPPVRLLRGIGLVRPLAVGLVVLMTFLVAVGLGAVLAKQITDLAADAPKYQATVVQKIERARDFIAGNALLTRLKTTVADLTAPEQPQQKPSASDRTNPNVRSSNTPKGLTLNKDNAQPVKVEIVSPAPGVVAILQTFAGFAASPLATAAFVAIFVVFILMQREDLRNRFIRLMGSHDLQRTTLALTETAKRLSRYFLAQVLLNAGFGVVVSAGLALIGVPSVVLWGILAFFMRFIPYIGSIAAVSFPILLAAAASSGWAMIVETAILFVVVEAIVSQIVEPLVYGRNTGISPIAVVLSATFWTWLWGPVGLVLSTPLTVCLVVLGRHVDRLAFLDVLFGDAPPLTRIETFYQRMLAGDPSEILDDAESYLRERSLVDYCDKIAMQALLMAQIDVRREALDEKRQLRIRDTMRDLIVELADQDLTVFEPIGQDAPAALEGNEQDDRGAPDPEDMLPKPDIAADWAAAGAVLCVAGRTPLDEAAAHLLADLLTERGIGSRVEPAESLTGNAVEGQGGLRPKLVVLSFLDADLSVAQARFAVRRLRRQLPDVPLVAAFWMPEDNGSRIEGLCRDVRCETCVASLPQALKFCLERAGREPIASAA